MPGELKGGDPIVNRMKRFEFEVYNVIMDSVSNEFDKRFSKHEYLYKNLVLLDPRNFKAIIHEEFKNNRLKDILKLIPTIDISKLKSELSQFAREWPSLKNPTLLRDIQDNNNYLDDGDEDENDSDQGPEHKRKAKGCGTDGLIGCLKVLVDCNLFSAAYETQCCLHTCTNSTHDTSLL